MDAEPLSILAFLLLEPRKQSSTISSHRNNDYLYRSVITNSIKAT